MNSIRNRAAHQDGNRLPSARPVFGYFIWAGHFLVVYIAAALAWTFGVDMANGGTRATFLAVLVIVTLAAAALVGAHAWRRYQRYRGAEDKGFLLSLTLGNGAIATAGILWQFLSHPARAVMCLVPLSISMLHLSIAELFLPSWRYRSRNSSWLAKILRTGNR